MDEALGDEDAARAVYDEACVAAAANPLVWEGAVNFERHRTARPVAERLRRVREVVGRCCGDDPGGGVTRGGRGDAGDDAAGGDAAGEGEEGQGGEGSEAAAAAAAAVSEGGYTLRKGGYTLRKGGYTSEAAGSGGTAAGLCAEDRERLSSYAAEFADLVAGASLFVSFLNIFTFSSIDAFSLLQPITAYYM